MMDEPDAYQLYEIDGIILRWVPGRGPERETGEGWVPYHQLARFAHEAMPITEAEAAAIRASRDDPHRPPDGGAC